MDIKIGFREVKIRRHNSQKLEGQNTFTGNVGYQIFGTLGGKPFRLSLGVDEETVAKRRTAKIERAVLEGSTSPVWAELADSLPSPHSTSLQPESATPQDSLVRQRLD